MTEGQSPAHPEPSLVETLQSLIVAFVLAMTFRGFVVEGFVIPTGSMAPTLMGAHARIQSRQTGWSFAAGMDQGSTNAGNIVADPMIGPSYSGSAGLSQPLQRRMGDRILVIKSLYPFAEPQRFDVVVFKNPTRSQGDEANYIKRLIGLPNEELWLCDGDVFTRRDGESGFSVRRKPSHVQAAVWQPVHNSDFVPVSLDRLNEQSARRWAGPPWVGDSTAWDLSTRDYVCSSDAATELRWESTRRELNDWTAYNLLSIGPNDRRVPLYPVSDLRVAATIIPQRDGLAATLEMQVRSHILEFNVQGTTASMRMRPAGSAADAAAVLEREATIDAFAAGRPLRMECWHADQALRLFINGKEVMEPLEYDWTPLQRLQHATSAPGVEDAKALLNRATLPPRIRWVFSGSPLTLRNVRVDRDLHYRRDTLTPKATENRTNDGFDDIVRMGMPAYGTHPDNLAKLGPDHFMMAGDNSQMSLDSRLWGNPDPIASRIDPAPFLVNRKLLLGKAWVVYFPAPYAMKQGGWPIVPDFGRLRFIR